MWYYQSLVYFIYFTLIIFVSTAIGLGPPSKAVPKSSYAKRLKIAVVTALFFTCIVTLLDLRFPFGFD